MQISSAVFLKSALKPVQYPEADRPEIAFAGRSNVGKSSMINCLLNRRGLVRTSSTPGRTQMLNFFDINERFRFVDLPGYGFARVPMAVKKSWGPMIRAYLESRSTLRGVVFILDIRRTPSEEDLRLLDWLEEYGCPTIMAVTKADKLARSRRDRQIETIASTCGLPVDAFTLFSATTRQGKDEIWERIETALEQPTSPA
jgi:GTP-binding protein